MVVVAVTPAATDKSWKSWEFSESASWSNHEQEVSGKPVASRSSENSWYSKAASRKTATSFSCLQQLYFTWRKSFRSDDKFLAEVKRITWMTSTSTSLYGVYSWMSHSKLQLVHLGRDFLNNQRMTKNQLLTSAKQLFQMTESWSRIRQKSVVGPRLIFFEKNLRGNRLYYVTKRLRLRIRKPMSSPTRCCVWKVSVTNQSKPGTTKLNGIW